ncbi:hypothetical protein CYMTET_17930 [Cymbomonas tetramitiformis]|uniref:Uncharacterized protein n=1 Tax=Cymbomonas tetramitiformis TaxID=36881 RepID=A0AAE0L6F6_9CHLO|nr:hypothetical protein CYMTET_17930 [Cymbomonas tetramitiformis]
MKTPCPLRLPSCLRFQQSCYSSEVAPLQGLESLDNVRPEEFRHLCPLIKTGDIALLWHDSPATETGRRTLQVAIFAIPDLRKGATERKPALLTINSQLHPQLKAASSVVYSGTFEAIHIVHLKGVKDVSWDLVNDVIEAKPTHRRTEHSEDVARDWAMQSAAFSMNVLQTFGVLKRTLASSNAVTPEAFLDPKTLGFVNKIRLARFSQVLVPKICLGSAHFVAMAKEMADNVLHISDPPAEATVTYSELLPQLQTGDLVLFSGATVSGAVIKLFSNSRFSHVGIVIKDVHEFDPDEAFVWESSTNKAGLTDVVSGEVRHGVELLSLEAKVNSGWYDEVAIRHLMVPEDKRRGIATTLRRIQKEWQGRPYEISRLEMLNAIVDIEGVKMFENTKDLSSLFCSELVAEAYMELGLLSTELPSNEYVPEDFASAKLSQLLNGSHLTDEVFIKIWPRS